MNTRLLIAPALLALALLAACGGGSDSPSPTPAAHSPAVVPSATPAPPGSLAASLLTAADLSGDWQLGERETFGPDTTFCGFSPPADLQPQERVSRNFTNTKNGFTLAQYISRFGEEGEAASVLDEYRAAIGPCDTWTVPGAVGDETRYAVSTLEIEPGRGEESFAFKVSLPVDVEGASDNAQLEISVVLTRVGSLVNWLVYGGLPVNDLPVQQIEDLVMLAVSKIEQA